MKNVFPKVLLVAVLIASSVTAFADDAQWGTDYAKALEQAGKQNKAVLLDFTGSDWCGWCMKMKKEALDKPEFKEYAKNNLLLMEVDFPHQKMLPPAVKKQNQELSQKFKAHGYPCFVLVDGNGKELGRQDGYLEGGSTAFIAKLNTFHTPVPAKAGSGRSIDSFDSFFHKPSPSPAP
jgi:protein disulfide-isomerase